MARATLREIQAPIKERHRQEPSATKVTLIAIDRRFKWLTAWLKCGRSGVLPRP